MKVTLYGERYPKPRKRNVICSLSCAFPNVKFRVLFIFELVSVAVNKLE